MATVAWTEHPRMLRLRLRFAFVDLLVRIADNYRVHRTGRNAALVAHYGFLSMFPLLLVFTTVLGYVLDSRPTLRESIIDSTFSHIPIIGPQLAQDPSQIQGDSMVLVIGLLVTLWAGLAAFNMLQFALDDIAEVPLDQRANFVFSRLRSLLGVAIIGGGQIAAAVLTGFVAFTGVPLLQRLLLILGALVVNIVVLAASYQWMAQRRRPWRQIAPGAVSAGVAIAGLQLVGTTVVGRAISKATPVCGTFATVIGLMAWMAMLATVALSGAELNHALPMRRLDNRRDDHGTDDGGQGQVSTT